MKYLPTVQVLERGILTSSYKQEIRYQSQIEKSKSLSQIKSTIFSQNNIESNIGAVLRVSLFVVAFIVISF